MLIRFLIVLLLITGSLAGSAVTITLQPGPAHSKDTYIVHHQTDESYAANNYGSAGHMEATAWTWSGRVVRFRSLLDFDLESIPANTQITGATLYLYHDPARPHNPLTGSNACLISRITSPWDASSVTWNTQPAYSTVNEALTTASTHGTENFQLNVTALVQDMLDNPSGSHGFMIRLATEATYRQMAFSASESSDPALRPKLVITYTDIHTLTLKPGSEGKDARLLYRQDNASVAGNNYGDIKVFDGYAWTSASNHVLTRSLIEFDLSTLPADAIIVNASLKLFGYPDSPNNPLSGSNACLLRRVMQPWNEHTVTWNNQPSTSIQNETYVPASTLAMEDYTIDVTSLYRDIWSDPEQNYGLMMKLETELPWRALHFCSSDFPDASRHPELIIRYQVCNAEFSDRNYIRAETITKEGVTSLTMADQLSIDEKVTEVQYFDGLGRIIQQVSVAFSPQGFDIVNAVGYDQAGRQTKNYLPFVACSYNGAYIDNFTSPLHHFYHQQDRIPDTDFPFAERVTDQSPLGSILEQGSPGEVFQPGNKTLRHTIRPNQSNEVRHFVFNGSAGTANGAGYYAAGTLAAEEITDEDGRIALVFTDKLGRVVLQRRTMSGLPASQQPDTYYVYDDFGNLRFVITPEAMSVLPASSYLVEYTGTAAANYMYACKYDRFGRITEKKIPGTDAVYYIYDTNDRMVLSQDGKQRYANTWTYIKYDELGREILNGLYTHDSLCNRAQMQALFNSENADISELRQAGTPYGYSNRVWPDNPARCEVLTVQYYDDYDFGNDGNPDFSYFTQGVPGEEPPWLMVAGLATGSRTKVLGSADTYLWTITFYDKYLRPVQVRSSNHLNSASVSDVATSVYDFAGRELRNTIVHNPGTGNVTVNQRRDLDHAGRPVRSYMQINDEAEVMLAAYRYNELGQLEEKNLHSEDGGQSFLQSIDYSYNLRGRLTHINNATLSNDGLHNNDDNDLFGMELYYEAASDAGQIPVYNGNIAHMRWKSANTHTSQIPQGYNLEYDFDNRLTNARYVHRTSATWQAADGYSETGMSYDRNGNILSLNRYSNGALTDQLSYTYRGNRLIKVEDAIPGTDGFRNGVNIQDEYIYDVNGNMTYDLNKNLPLQYNHLNLVSRYRVHNDVLIIYDALGNKLSHIQQSSDNRTEWAYQYVGPFMYTQSGHPCSGPSCLGAPIIQTEEGRIKPGTGGYSYQYDLKDHLGSVRMTFDKDPVTGLARIVQEDHYYAFGGKLAGRSYDFANGNRYTYTGQEYLNEVEVYDHGARMYDHQLGRWHAVDPLAELYVGYSPYSYVLNNPIVFLDPTGLGVEDFIYMDTEGNEIDRVSMPGEDRYFMTQTGITGAYEHNGLTYFEIDNPNGFSNSGSPADFFGGYTLTPGDYLGHYQALFSGDFKKVLFDEKTGALRPDALHAGLPGGGIASGAHGLYLAGSKNVLPALANVAKGSTTVFKSFTKSNFRHNLGQLTGNIPANSQAHHVFPQKFQSIFSSKGINIHDPKFGAWWQTSSHLKNAKAYNTAWENWLTPTKTQSEIMNFGRQLMGQYGIPVGF